jgi:hypothetical protein
MLVYGGKIGRNGCPEAEGEVKSSESEALSCPFNRIY